MKKKINLLVLFLSMSSLIVSQSKNQYFKAKVSYGINIVMDKNSLKHKALLETFPEKAAKIETVSKELDFTLVFNDSIAMFYMEKKLFSDNRVVSLAVILSKYFGRIKQQSNNYITEELQESFGKFLVVRKYQNWKLHDETKQIGEYLCFKATTFYTVTNPKGKVFKYDYTAWYTPQLPYKFGPAGYGNLPGLIVELQGESVTYGIKKIEFYNENEDKKNKMPKLKRKKLITEEEFEKLAAKDEKRWQNKD